MYLTAGGTAVATGLGATILNRGVQNLSSTGDAQSGGTATPTRRLPTGGLTDFGIWANGMPDTAMTRDMAHTTGNDSTTTATRGTLTATAPGAYAPGGSTLWNAATYAGVGIKWSSIPAGEKQAFGSVQLERVPTDNRLSWDATSWEGRGCYTAQGNVTNSQVSPSNDVALSGATSGKITYTDTLPTVLYYSIEPTTPLGLAPCTAGEALNGSVALNMVRGAWWTPVVQYYDASYNRLGGVLYNAFSQHPGGGVWSTGYVYNAVAPANSVWVSVVPVISVSSTPTGTDNIATVGETAYVDVHRIWARPYAAAGTPTPYVTPRALTISVLANRVNLLNNPGFDVDTWGWGAYGTGTSPFPLSVDGTIGRTRPGAGKFALPSDTSGFGMGSSVGVLTLEAWSTSNIGGFGWKPSTTYTTSAYVRLAPGCPPVTLAPGGYTATAGVLTTSDALTHPELLDDGWIRLWATFTTDPSDNGLVGVSLSLQTSQLPTTGGTIFWVDDILCEEGSQLLPYFDGSSPSPDYMWAGTPGRSSSHYYQGFQQSAYRLNDIVRGAAPHGTQYQFLYAQPPS